MRKNFVACVLVEHREHVGEHDVDDAPRAGGIGGGVAEVDRDDVRGEPELGIEDGLQDDERVAIEREVVGEEQSEEADDGGDDVAKAEPVDRFEDERHQDDGPADEDCGGIEIGDGRAAGNVNARDECERV